MYPIVIMIFNGNAFAQGKMAVSGKITDAAGEPLQREQRERTFSMWLPTTRPGLRLTRAASMFMISPPRLW